VIEAAAMTTGARPLVGVGYRSILDEWIRNNLNRFEVLEVTVDNFKVGGEASQAAIVDLVGQIPLTAHGIGLSIGTDGPLDFAYLDEIAAIIDRVRATAYSEHLAFTQVPGYSLGNLLPLPSTEAVAESVIAKVRCIQSRISVPFLLENITYLFQWPDSDLSDAEFLNLICSETGSGLLLDIENLYLNASNHGVDPYAFLDALPPGLAKEMHLAGGVTVRESFLEQPFLADSHSHRVPDGAWDLLEYALVRQKPHSIIIERFDAVDEILDDVTHLRTRIDRVFGAPA